MVFSRMSFFVFSLLFSTNMVAEEQCVVDLLSVLNNENVKTEKTVEEASPEDYFALLELVRESIDQTLLGIGGNMGTPRVLGRVRMGTDLPAGVVWEGRIISGHIENLMQMEVTTYLGLVVATRTNQEGHVIAKIFTAEKSFVELNLNKLQSLKSTRQEFTLPVKALTGINIPPPKAVELEAPVVELVKKRISELHRRQREVEELEQYKGSDVFEQAFGERYRDGQKSVKEWDFLIQILERQHGIRINRETGEYEAWEVPREMTLPKDIPDVILDQVYKDVAAHQKEKKDLDGLADQLNQPELRQYVEQSAQHHREMMSIFERKISSVERQFGIKVDMDSSAIRRQDIPPHLRIPQSIPKMMVDTILHSWEMWKKAPKDIRHYHKEQIDRLAAQSGVTFDVTNGQFSQNP